MCNVLLRGGDKLTNCTCTYNVVTPPSPCYTVGHSSRLFLLFLFFFSNKTERARTPIPLPLHNNIIPNGIIFMWLTRQFWRNRFPRSYRCSSRKHCIVYLRFALIWFALTGSGEGLPRLFRAGHRGIGQCTYSTYLRAHVCGYVTSVADPTTRLSIQYNIILWVQYANERRPTEFARRILFI